MTRDVSDNRTGERASAGPQSFTSEQARQMLREAASFYRSCAMAGERPTDEADAKHLNVIDNPYGICGCGEAMDGYGCPRGH